MIKTISASVIGKSHIKNNLPCQDYAQAYKFSNNKVSIVLCDGAGSSKYSDIAAKITTETLINYFKTNKSETLLKKSDKFLKKEILDLVNDKIKQSMRLNNHNSIRDYYSTLLFTFINIKKNFFIAGHIGDGVIGILENNWSILSEPQNGEFNNTTFFVTQKKSYDNFRLYRGQLNRKVKGFLLMSDGSSESLYNKKENKLAPAIDTISKWLFKYSEIKVNIAVQKNLEDIIRNKTMDDCSLAMTTIKPYSRN